MRWKRVSFKNGVFYGGDAQYGGLFGASVHIVDLVRRHIEALPLMLVYL